MSYGLKGKVRQIVGELDTLRGRSGRPRDISLRQYLAQNYQTGAGEPLQPGHLFAELEIDPQSTQVHELMNDPDARYLLPEIIRTGIGRGMGLSRSQTRPGFASHAPLLSEGGGGQHFVSPEVFLDPVMRGAVQSVFYPDLVAREEPVPQPNVTVPRIDLSDAAVVSSEEGATIEEGSVSYNTKDIKLKKRAKGIKISYEAIQFNTLSFVELFFQDLGRMLGASLNNDCVGVIVDGDQADGSEAATVVGVENISDGVTWFDIVRVAVQFSLLGRVGVSAVGNAKTALNYLNLPEVKNRVQGSALMPVTLRSPITLPTELYVSNRVGDSQIVVQDSSASLVQLTAQALMLETERIASKQLAGSYASIYTGFAKLQRNASIVIDGSIAFSSHGFPTWMNPFQG
jgi:hypothetical protein